MYLAILLYSIGIVISLIIITFTFFGKCYREFYINKLILHPDVQKANISRKKLMLTIHFLLILRLLTSWILIAGFLDDMKDIKRIQKMGRLSFRDAIRQYFSITSEDFDELNYH